MEVKDNILIEKFKFYILSKSDDIFMIGDLYIGKTKDVERRFKEHYEGVEKKNQKIYRHIRENGGCDNWVMTIFAEHIYTGTKQEINKLTATQERFYIEKYKSTLNKNRPIITKEERLELCRNRERRKLLDPEWRRQKNMANSKRNKKNYDTNPVYRNKILLKAKLKYESKKKK